MEKLSKWGEGIQKDCERRKRKKMEYDKLREKFLKLEKEVLPLRFSYELFLIEGEKYLRFSGDLVYPVSMLSTIIAGCQKEDIKSGSRTVGLILQIPNPFPKKIKKKASTQLKKIKKRK